jgi:tetratricopeptide (TPR) repeat protein
LLTAPALALAQQGAPPPAAPAAGRTAMYEDVETLRQILAGKLAPYANIAHPPPYAQPYPDFNNTLQFGTFNRPLNQYDFGQPRFNQPLGNPYGPQVFGTVQQVWITTTSFLEGCYLKGQGVVYTVTLPPGRDPRPQPPAAAPKPVSDWDRTRRELRGEPPPPAPAKPAAKDPSVADVILRALADNGHHFSQLGEGESITVVVTFRDPFQPAERPRKPSAPANPPRPSGPSGQQKAAAPSTAQDYELLGDLHLKQGKAGDAVQAYQKAIELKPDAKQLAELHTKTAAAYQVLAAGDSKQQQYAAMLRALEYVRHNPQGASAETSNTAMAVQALLNAGVATEEAGKPSVPLPPKLIVSVPRRLLDQSAAGQLSYADLQKAATVEYLTFDAPDRGGEKPAK